jgi:hypothetical protein
MSIALTPEQVVLRIIGPITPVGETYADSERLFNLETLIKTVDALICEIERVSLSASRPEASVQAIGHRANKYLRDLQLDLAERDG